jgi:hypothetical protein
MGTVAEPRAACGSAGAGHLAVGPGIQLGRQRNVPLVVKRPGTPGLRCGGLARTLLGSLGQGVNLERAAVWDRRWMAIS